MNCRDCKTEAVWVSLGRDIGEYWYCRSCKKEEKEWKTQEVRMTDTSPLGWVSYSPSGTFKVDVDSSGLKTYRRVFK